MYFLYRKDNGAISEPIRRGEPGSPTLNKELNCGIGRGVNWGLNELFYAPDNEILAEYPDFIETASLAWGNHEWGKCYIENDEIKENLEWTPPPKEER